MENGVEGHEILEVEVVRYLFTFKENEPVA